MGFITESGLKQLDKYEYKSGGYSNLDNLINPYWVFCVERVPLSVAPNLLTFIGAIFMIGSFGVILIYDHTLSKEVPAWCWFASAFFQFVYQTLDAIDGKQARRTKASSPLGQLFDHGCDAFSTTFIILTLLQQLRSGASEDLLMFTFFLQMAFFCPNWAEYHTKILNTHLGGVGVTEGELLVIATLLLSGIFGTHMWSAKLTEFVPTSILEVFGPWIMKVTVNQIIFNFVYVGTSVLMLILIVATLKNCDNKLKAILQYTPIIFLQILLHVWLGSRLFAEYPAYLIICFGSVFAFITIKMIVCSVTHMDFPALHIEFVPLLAFTVFFKLFEPILPYELARILFFACIAGIMIFELAFISGVVNQITEHLGIYCFQLGKRPKKTQ